MKLFNFMRSPGRDKVPPPTEEWREAFAKFTSRSTEKARQVLFWARYEAGEFRSPCVETEHLLLGLVHADIAVLNRFLDSPVAIDSIRERIDKHTESRQKRFAGVDVPLSDASRRILVYGVEEAARAHRPFIGTEHVLIGLLREEKGFAAEFLLKRGVQLLTVREGLEPPNSVKPDLKFNSVDGLTYVWIPPGLFQMGCSWRDAHYSESFEDEKPAHSVTITKGFWIGQTPVTQAAYQRVMGANPSYFRGDQLPVEGVSWNNACAYCSAVRLRLPTEAEWEYAASMRGSALEGMGGLKVWQWTADWYDEDYYSQSPSQDPHGPESGQFKVLRGGPCVVNNRLTFRKSLRAKLVPDCGNIFDF